jgi:peptidyl-prolyl cis-trans isomerase C
VKRQGVTARMVLAAVLLAGIGCGRKEGERPAGGRLAVLQAGEVARVGESTLADADLQRLIPPEIRETVTGAEVRDIVDRWVRTELLFQRAMQEGLDRDPEVAARRRDAERDLLADAYLQRELENRVRVGSDEIQAYYRQHQAEYTQELQLKHILVDTREEAEEILQALRGGAGFEDLARQRSTDPTAAGGGDLGFLGKGAMNPAFEPHVFGLQPGEYAGPIATTFGYHIVKVAARRPATDPLHFDAARDEIMHNLMLQKQQAAQAQILADLRRESPALVAPSWGGLSLAPEATAPAAPAPVAQVAGPPPAGAATDTLGRQ